MREAKDTICNFSGKTKESIFEDIKKSIEDFEKMGFEVEDVKISYGKPRFQSDPEEGNLPKKQNDNKT